MTQGPMTRGAACGVRGQAGDEGGPSEQRGEVKGVVGVQCCVEVKEGWNVC